MILCAGEALIDMLPRRTEAGEAAFAPHPGGAVFNTAIALGRLGAPAGFLSGLSTDLFGEMLERALAESGVDARLCVRSGRPTTLAFVTLEGGQARYAFYDENSALRALTPGDMPALPEEVTAIFVGGISLVGLPCAEAFEALAAGAGGRAVMIDPNVRAAFVTAAGEPGYRERLARLLPIADIVKLSDEDLHWIEGEGEERDLARAVLARGPKLVCVTRGAHGVTGYTAAGETYVPATLAEVVDTVGAGDTFNAGLLAALHEAGALSKAGIAELDEGALHAALALGTRAAAITVGRAGANPPRREEL